MKIGSINRDYIIRYLRFVVFMLLSILFNLGLLVSRISAGSPGNVLGLSTTSGETSDLTITSARIPISNVYIRDIQYHSNITTKDKRVYVLDEYFRINQSPLYGTAQIMVDKCEQYGAPSDCIILAAIARNETDLCKYHNSFDMMNCWGFGGGGIYRITFNSWDEVIDRITSVLTQQYGNAYIINPSLMERTFCGDEPGCTNWGAKIKGFAAEIDNFGISLGVGSILNMR